MAPAGVATIDALLSVPEFVESVTVPCAVAKSQLVPLQLAIAGLAL